MSNEFNALLSDPKIKRSPLLYNQQGLICRHEGSPSEAIKCFQKAVELNSTNPEYYREIAKTL